MGYFMWAILIAAVLGLIYGLWQRSRQNRAVQMAAQQAGAIDGVECKHVAGLGLNEGADCQVWAYADRLEIRETESGQVFSLALAKVRAIEAKTAQEIKQAHRSILGRAVIGNLIVPGAGAIVGAMTGLDKTKKVTRDYLIINYVDQNGELQGITFAKDGDIFRLHSFVAGVKKQLAQIPREAVTL